MTWTNGKLMAMLLGIALPLWLTGTPATATEDGPMAAGSEIYVRCATWSETMAATRTAYQEWLTDLGGQSDSAAQPVVEIGMAGTDAAKPLSLDLTGQRWLRLVTVCDEGAGNCHVWGDAILTAMDGTVVRLSSLPPMAALVGWGEVHRDRNWQQKPLQIADRVFEHGVWVHANSDLCYELDGRFSRFEALVGMDAARRQGRARFMASCTTPNLLPAVWRRICADFPGEGIAFERDTSSRHLDWLAGNASLPTESVARQAISRLGPTRTLLETEAETLKAAEGVGDREWLELYLRAGRLRTIDGPLAAVWIVDLQRPFLGRLEQLRTEDEVADAVAWQELQSRVERAASAIGEGRRLDLNGLRASIEDLSAALPQRFSAGAQLLAGFDERRPAWQATFDAAVDADESVSERLQSAAAEIGAVRRALLLSLDSMAEFLAVPAHQGLPEEWRSEYQMLQYDLRNVGHFRQVAATTYRPESLILDTDRDPVDIVLRRTAALLQHLTRMADTPDLAAVGQELSQLLVASNSVQLENQEARYVLFADACRLRRRIALQNPLLDFDQILFIKRHRALFNHMCDQYYGMAATPGGGLYVLSDAFGAEPTVRDVLADATVTTPGRLQGRQLAGGSTIPPAVSFDGMGNRHGQETSGGTFLSPDLSYDASQALFAYVENTGDMLHRDHVDPTQGHWDEGRCYHVFSVNLDGTELRQLTDGTWNDFDPCWLPNGRVAFISERRGGYLRCGRVCPNYTLFDMAADGSDITCLSFHETNEWHPSVTNEGLLLWTRWDYVDRHGCTAHMPWVTTLDGRDPRAVHGNFSVRSSRPDMEVDCRSIPNSHKISAIAAPHHGQAYGSLVLIDPHVVDDDGMGPIRRVTPEVGFPETQGGGQVYGTPWPLDEDFYLCVYDASMQPGAGQQGGQLLPGNYGIYLVDAFGNRELIYRDPEIGCLSPIPVHPRPVPPLGPELAVRGTQTNPSTRTASLAPNHEPTGTVAVMNVYESLKPWPDGTRIAELRVLQLFPMSVPSGRPPHETGVRVASAGDSVVTVRHVLGTVPVEADGSAFFTVPANRELFFQALDEQGLAVQSMRSATHVREGERLACAGCHMPRHQTPPPGQSMPLALQRAPSKLQPDVDGSNPFSYPRLVQPVLDRNCVQCHTENADKAPNLAREPIVRNWYASYESLVHQYGFYNYQDSYRTTPGQFGAQASRLFAMLQEGHHDVKLSDEDLHRLTLWLDCTSMFYGVYEKAQGEAQLRGEVAFPTLE